MREQLLDDVAARRFLLGQLSPEEQGRIEELAFEDPDTFTFLESVEDDLIDEFIQGDLSADEEQQFKNHFLSLPGRRSNLKISRLLQRHLDKIPDVPRRKTFSFSAWFPFLNWFKLQRPWLKVSVVAGAALVLVLFALWIITVYLQVTKPVPIQAGPDKPAALPSPSFEASPSLTPTGSPVHVENKPKSLTPEKQRRLPTYALLLPSASPRGEGGQQLKLAADASRVTIELALITQRNFKSYEAALEDETGRVLQRWHNLEEESLTSGKALKIELAAGLLKPQEFYRIVVSGINAEEKPEEIARYPFEVKQ